jgi:peptidoglycan hydrolase-like protein with peptidoglycan-binding domain
VKLFSPSAIRAEKRLLAGLTLIVVIAVVVAIVLLTRSPGSSNAASNGANGTGTATVQRRDLVETDTESGTLSYANARTIYNRVSGTITWLPNVGQKIRAGQALFRIDNQPIILMNGPTPAYRDLSASDVQGPDVLELNRNLIALGFNPDGIVDDDIWQAATTAGVEQFQASMGETETGILTLGQVVFLPGAQLISTVDGTVGSTGGGSGGSTASSYDPTGSHTEFVSLTSTTQTSTSTQPTTTPTTPPSHGGHPHKRRRGGHKGQKGSQSLSALVALLKAEIQELKAQQHGSPSSPSSPAHHSPHHSSSHSNSPSNNSSTNSPSSSSSGSTATEILQSSSTHLVVTVDLAASSQSEAVRGEHVTVEMPNNTTVNGVITQVSKVAQTSSSGNSGAGAGAGGGGGGGNGSGGSSATIPVTVKLLGHITGVGLDQAPVSVNFAQAKAKNVLSVPVTALVATAGSNYAVQGAAAPHKLIPVKTGLFAAGYVAISGAGIYEGLQVTDSQG